MARFKRAGLTEDIREVLDILEVSYHYCRPFFDRANRDIQIYEQVIDPKTWSTMSEVTLGGGYRLVANALPNLCLNVLWSPEYPFDLVPEGGSAGDDTASYDLSNRLRKFLLYTLRERMNIEVTGYPSVIEGVKIGCGYGIVEPKVIYTAERKDAAIVVGGKSARRKILDVAEPSIVPSYRYLPFGSVLPSPDGATPDEVSCITVVDTIDEYTFRDMYNGSTENSNLMGNPEEIIEYCRKNGFDAATTPMRQIIAKLAGRDGDQNENYNPFRNRTLRGTTQVPILKQFRKNKHIWIACGRFKIYESEKTVQTLSKPVVKYTMAPESGNWFSRGIIGPSGDMLRGNESFTNALLDLFTLHLHPHQVVNVDSLIEQDRTEDLQPYARTLVRGEPTRAFNFVTPPVVPPQVLQVGDRLQSFTDDLAGLNTQLGAALSPGIVRGGSSSLDTLLASSTNREKMYAKHLENQWYKPLIQHTLVLLAVYAKEDQMFSELKTQTGIDDQSSKRKVGDRYFETIKVTTDDLTHTWRVSLNFREKFKNWLAESAHRLQVFDRLIKDPEVNTTELKRYLIGEDSVVDRLMSGVSKEGRLGDIQALTAALAGPQGAAGAEAPLNPNAPGGALGGGGQGVMAEAMAGGPEGGMTL